MASGKFTFDPFASPNPLIQLLSPNVAFTGTELYSDAAEFAENQNDGMDHRVPVLAAGNFPLGGGVSSDSIFRVMEPWKILPYGGTYRLDVTGTVITDGGVSVPYINQTVAFTIGEEINGQNSDALGFVAADSTPGVGDGTLIVTDVRGVFEDGEVVLGDQGGTATLNAVPAETVTNPFVDAPSGTVTIIVTAASSGTVAFSETINDQSFMGAVWLDIARGNPGTDFPRGTPTDPVNNFTDASVIALARKLNKFHLEGVLVLAGGENIEDTDWQGNSPVQSTLELNGLSTLGNDFRDMTVDGQLNGDVTAVRCHLHNIVDFSGHASGCMLDDMVTLAASASTEHHFDHCHSGVAGLSTPVLDCNGTNQDINIRHYTGGIEIRNFTQGNMSIDMASGNVVLDSTCTGGVIVVRGVTLLTDNSAGSTVYTAGVVNPEAVATATWTTASTVGSAGSFGRSVADMTGQLHREIYIDTELVPVGNGYQNTPYNNWSDAVDDAEANGVTHLVLKANATVDRQIRNFCIRGVADPTIDLDGQNMDGTTISAMHITGAYTGFLHTINSHLLAVSGVQGDFHDTVFSDGGLITMAASPSGPSLFLKCVSGVAGTATPILDCNSTNKDISIRQYSGGLEIRNFTQQDMTLDLVSGNIIIAASCTGGVIVVRGVGTLVDNSAGTTVVSTGLISSEAVADALARAEVGVNYDPQTTTISLNVWGVRGTGAVATATDCVVDWYTNDGTLLFQATNDAPDARGHFDFTHVQSLTAGAVYYVVVTVNDSEGPLISSHTGQIVIA